MHHLSLTHMMRRYMLNSFIIPLVFSGSLVSATPPPSPPALSEGPHVVSVTTGEQLQQAIRDHTRHIIINDHLDLTALPLFAADTITSTAVGVVLWGTDSIRGNCTNPSPHSSLWPARQSDRQCVLDIFEDFLELQKSNLWLHDIYLRMTGDSTKDHATYFGAHNGNLWLTQCVMRGDGFRARASDTHNPWKAYARDTWFTRFSKDAEAVWRFQQGTTAAFARCNFTDNAIPAGAQGSVIGARASSSETYMDPSYFWLQECTFAGNRPAEAAVVRMHAGSRVYTDTPATVTVYDSSRRSHTQPWLVRLPTAADRQDTMVNTSMFLNERDAWFAAAVQDQADASGLPEVQRFYIPPAVVAFAPAPHATTTGWHRGQILAAALIFCGSCAAGIVTAAGVCAAYVGHLARVSHTQAPHAGGQRQALRGSYSATGPATAGCREPQHAQHAGAGCLSQLSGGERSGRAAAREAAAPPGAQL
eukprot:jgi/Ulvmu1/11838/UM080_0050.1